MFARNFDFSPFRRRDFNAVLRPRLFYHKIQRCDVGGDDRAGIIGIDVCLHVDLEEPGRSDRLEDTVDYGNLAGEITAMAESSSFQLLERLAEEVAALALAQPKVEQVEVKVIKPGALPRGRAAAVEIFRDRSSSNRPMGFGRFV